MIAVVRGVADVGRWGNPRLLLLNKAPFKRWRLGPAWHSLCLQVVLGLSGLAQVSFDIEGEFVAKHFRQTRCANFVARLCLALSFAELDALGLGWRLSIDALCSSVWAEWADSGQGRWPNASLGTSAVVPLSTPSPSERRWSRQRSADIVWAEGSRRMARVASPRVLVYRPRHLAQHHSRQ